ncbi:hypothetical protein [Almyronema epifaneia]|uniref:Mechanosensitive ion channel protein MscS n=1 Tax=Almyronema epifaneia S1 TaxID=2991925 RepID=A0ABW6ICV7_9CYAN
MDRDLRQAVFTQARDRFERVGQWLGLAMVILLIFQVLTLQPFISLSRQIAQAQAHSQQLAQIQPSFEQLEAAIEATQPYREQINQAADETAQALIADFASLDQVVQEIRSEAPSAVANPDSAEPAAARLVPVQQPSSTAESAPPTELALTPTLAAEIQQVNEIDALRAVLTPYLRSEIIDPRFAQLNRRLEDIGAEIEGKADDILVQTEAIQRQVKAIPAATPLAQQTTALQTQVETIKDRVATLAVRPPADNDWWRSARGKVGVTQSIANVAVEKLLPTSLETAANQLTQDLNTLLSQQQALQAELAQAIALLEADFSTQQEKLAGLGTPFKWVALDLDFAAARFPLLLAGILSALLAWQSQRLQALAAAICFQPAPRQALWDWYFYQTRGLVTGLSLRSLKQVQQNLLPIGLLVWVAIAAFQVSWLEQVSLAAALLMLLLAWGLLLLAFEQRRRVWQQGLSLSRREEAESPAAPIDEATI